MHYHTNDVHRLSNFYVVHGSLPYICTWLIDVILLVVIVCGYDVRRET